MKIFKRIIIILLAVIAILVIVGFLLPRKYKVERNIVIHAPDSVIYDLTVNLHKWDIWTSWNKTTDSTVVFELKGPDGQVGTTRSWNSKHIGNGDLTITETKPNQLLGYDLAFEKGKFKSSGTINIERSADSCKVTWTDEGDVRYNPVSRYFALFMDKMMGPDFEKGLAKLKTVAEERKNWPAISVVNIKDQTVILIRDSAGPQDYATVMGKGFMEISNFIHKNNLTAEGHPFAIYLRWDSVTMFSVMDLGIAVQKADIQPSGRTRLETIPQHMVVITRYFGPYDKTAAAYYALEKYCHQENLEITGGPREIYVTDPMVEKDPMKVETDIEFPVKY